MGFFMNKLLSSIVLIFLLMNSARPNSVSIEFNQSYSPFTKMSTYMNLSSDAYWEVSGGANLNPVLITIIGTLYRRDTGYLINQRRDWAVTDGFGTMKTVYCPDGMSPSNALSVNTSILMSFMNNLLGPMREYHAMDASKLYNLTQVDDIPEMRYACRTYNSELKRYEDFFIYVKGGITVDGEKNQNSCIIVNDILDLNFALTNADLSGVTQSASLSYDCHPYGGYYKVSLLTDTMINDRIALGTSGSASVYIDGVKIKNSGSTISMHSIGLGLLNLQIELHGIADDNNLTSSSVLLFQPL